MFLFPQPTTSCYTPRGRPSSIYPPFSPFSSSYSDSLRAEREYQDRLRREQAIRERAEYLRRAREREELQRREEALRAQQIQEERRRRALQNQLFGSPMFSPFFGQRPQYYDEEDEEEDTLRQRSPTRTSRSPSPQKSDAGSARIRVPIRGQSRESSPAPSPRSDPAPTQPEEPSPTSSTLATADEAAHRSAAVIQQHWKSFKSRQSSLATISRYTSEFEERKSSFTFPSQLDFSPTSSHPILLYTSNNAPFHAYENDLTKLLTRIDAVESAGSIKVREARKALILAIEAELEALDRKKLNAWEDKVRAEKASEETQVEMDLDIDPAKNREHQSTPTSEPEQIPLPSSPVLESASLGADDESMANDVRESDRMDDEDLSVLSQDVSSLETKADAADPIPISVDGKDGSDVEVSPQ